LFGHLRAGLGVAVARDDLCAGPANASASTCPQPRAVPVIRTTLPSKSLTEAGLLRGNPQLAWRRPVCACARRQTRGGAPIYWPLAVNDNAEVLIRLHAAAEEVVRASGAVASPVTART
jgi:hypothetical protein